MLNHEQIWAAIDAFARLHRLTPSGLARKAGLDPTTFNKSKRISSDGRLRWPSTESLAKILEATGADTDVFTALLEKEKRQPLPFIHFNILNEGVYFDEHGLPLREKWSDYLFSAVKDPKAYAVQISKGSSLTPAFRDGDIAIVSPSSPARNGDRVFMRIYGDNIRAYEIMKEKEKSIEFVSLNPDYAAGEVARDRINWMSRIVWVSQ